MEASMSGTDATLGRIEEVLENWESGDAARWHADGNGPDQLASDDSDAEPRFDPAQLLAQIGRMNLLAISGCRVSRRENGITLPVSNGYSVEVDLAPDDTYTVRRVFTRSGRRWVKGERTGVYAEDVSGAAYYASCFRSYDETEWMSK
jgi:hypothetical protein